MTGALITIIRRMDDAYIKFASKKKGQNNDNDKTTKRIAN